MEFVRTKKVSLGLDMAPLIDVVFQLLIFFMLTSSFSHPALKLTLPKAVEHDPREPEQIVVSIDKRAHIFVNQEKISMKGLKPYLAAKLARDPKKAIHLQGDSEMPYRLFVQVVDQARQAGARQIHILHKPQRQV